MIDNNVMQFQKEILKRVQKLEAEMVTMIITPAIANPNQTGSV